MYKLVRGMNIGFQMEENGMVNWLDFEFNKNSYKNYLRCYDRQTGTKGLQTWINRTWEVYYGQTALLDWLGRVDIDEDMRKKLSLIIRKENVFYNSVSGEKHYLTYKEIDELYKKLNTAN